MSKFIRSEASAQEWKEFSEQFDIDPHEMWSVMKQMERDKDSIEKA